MGKRPTGKKIKYKKHDDDESKDRLDDIIDYDSNEKFTRVPYGKNKVCDDMNSANDDYTNWIPENNVQRRLKKVIDDLEKKYSS